MGKLEVTPVDELSGLPLLLVPDEAVLPIVWGFEPDRSQDGRILADWNHAWHPAREIIEAGEGWCRTAQLAYPTGYARVTA